MPVAEPDIACESAAQPYATRQSARARGALAGLIACGLVCWSAAAWAHDFWIEPATFTPAPGSRVAANLRVGHDRSIEEYPRKPERIVRFELHGGHSTAPVPIKGKAGAMPAGQVAVAGPGVYTMVYQSTHAFVDLDAARFENYLREEGLERIVDERKQRGESQKRGKESYARYCKALLRVGESSDGFDRKLGLPLELTAVVNPYALGKDDTLELVVEFQGKPLAGARVELISLADLTRKTEARSDAHGRVRFVSPGTGKWMLATTHMRRAPAGMKGDWESFWATLSFAVNKR